MGRGSGVWTGRVLRFALPVVALAAAGWGATGSAALSSPEELAPNTVARISDVPDRAGTITRAEFRHALASAAAQKGRHAAPKPGEPGYERLMRVAVDALLETVWIKGQAVEMNIVIARSQISRELARIKKQHFKSAAEYHEFLREMHLTRRDMYERVELLLLSVRIQNRIVAGARSESEERKASEKFAAEFNERWRGRTVCAPEYVTELCSNSTRQRSLARSA